MDNLLNGKVAVVTGGASGIGRSIARLFAEHGAAVVVADLQAAPREGDDPPIHEVIQEQLGGEARYVACDVTNPDQVADVMAAADDMGGVDILINNAGVFRQHDFLSMTAEDFNFVMDINVKAAFFVAQAAAQRMVEQGAGVILNLSSVAGIQGSAGFTTYCASKGAVRLFTYALAAELGPQGVRVNALHPGLIDTKMTTDDVPVVGSEMGEGFKQQIPMGRFGHPDEMAKAALFLASDMSSYMQGASLVADGGLLRV